MEIKEIIQTFLDENNIPYTETSDHFFLTSLKIEIPFTRHFQLSQMHWSMISMEIGVNRVNQLIEDLKEPEGAQIYEFSRKKRS